MKHILLGGLFLLMSQLPGQSTDVRLNGLKEEVSHLMATHQTVGMSVCIVENDQVIFSESFGYRDYGNKIPVTNRTIFPIGSITKPITASLIGAFTGQYPLHVKDKPRTYIPYLEFATCDMNKLVTLEDLLAHRSGIGVVDGAHVFFPTDNIEQHLKRLPHLRPNSQVRERFDYSNMGYAILGEISAKISGETWAANIQNTIFNPLQMEHSNCSIADLESSDDPAVGYGVADGQIIRVAYED
ncbi:MAG: serine hydrolase domain-containing protein, partial [Flavobacteriaceae bacterium]